MKRAIGTVFTGNTPSPPPPTHTHRKQSLKGAQDFIVHKIVCHQRATVAKLNSPTVLSRSHNK